MSEGIEMTGQELQEEEHYNMVGFTLISDALSSVEAPTNLEPQHNLEIGKAVMNVSLVEYFEENQKEYLNPDLRKYIIAGATMAYVHWVTKNTIDDGEQKSE
jgi:hypothetical protein